MSRKSGHQRRLQWCVKAFCSLIRRLPNQSRTIKKRVRVKRCTLLPYCQIFCCSQHKFKQVFKTQRIRSQLYELPWTACFHSGARLSCVLSTCLNLQTCVASSRKFDSMRNFFLSAIVLEGCNNVLLSEPYPRFFWKGWRRHRN